MKQLNVKEMLQLLQVKGMKRDGPPQPREGGKSDHVSYEQPLGPRQAPCLKITGNSRKYEVKHQLNMKSDNINQELSMIYKGRLENSAVSYKHLPTTLKPLEGW